MSRVIQKYFPIFLKLGLFIIAFIPLINFQTTFYPYIFSKGFLFQVIIEILLVFYLTLILYQPQYRPKFNKLTISIFAFLGVLLISALFGKDIIRSFWGTQERMSGVFFMLHLGAFFLMLTSLFKNKKHWILFLRVNVIVVFLVQISALLSNSGFMQKIFFISDSGSTLGNPNFLGAYLLFFVFLIPLLFKIDKRVPNLLRRASSELVWRGFYIIVFLLNFIVIFKTANRGAIFSSILGLFIFFTLIVILYSAKKTQKYKIILGVYLALIILISSFIFILVKPEYAPQALKNQRFYGKAYIKTLRYNLHRSSRIESWKIGLNAWKERPVLGWGSENFSLAFDKKFDIRYIQVSSFEFTKQMFDKAHNIVIEILTANGFLGLLTYLMIFILCFIKLFQKRKQNSFASFLLLSLLISYFTQNLFSFDTPSSWILFFVVLALISFERDKKEGIEDDELCSQSCMRSQYSSLKPVSILLLLLVIITSLYYANFKSFRASQYTAAAQAMTAENFDNNQVLGAYQKALNIDSPYKFEIRKYLAKYFLAAAKTQKLDQDLFNKLSWQAHELEEDLKKRPNDPWTYFWLAQTYLLMKPVDEKFLDRALEISQKGVELAPKNYRFYYDLGVLYFEKQDCIKAGEYWDKASEYGEKAYRVTWGKGACKIGKGQFKTGLEMLEQALNAGYKAEDRLFDLVLLAKTYGQLDNLDKSLEYYLKAQEKAPENIEILIALASLYNTREEPQKAREITQKILAIDPSQKAEVEAFLQTLSQ